MKSHSIISLHYHLYAYGFHIRVFIFLPCLQLLWAPGCVESVLGVCLAPLERLSDAAWVVVQPAACQTLHAVLLHHPHAALRLSHHCLAAISCILSHQYWLDLTWERF